MWPNGSDWSMQNPKVLSQHARKVEPASPDPLLHSGWFKGVACETNKRVGFGYSLAIARPFTNHSTGCISSPARVRKGLVPLQTAFRCSGMQFIRPQIADTLSIPVGRYTNTSFEFATGKLEDTLLLFLLQIVPQQSCCLGYCRSHICCLRLSHFLTAPRRELSPELTHSVQIS